MQAEVVVCGAGIAGISAAYFLAAHQGVKDVLLVDERTPLSLTSDRSSECYRNWWPGPDDAMLRLMDRSIDLLEELAQASGNAFSLNRRGYLYCTGSPEGVESLRRQAEQISRLGAGPLRLHSGSPGEPTYLPHPVEGFTGQPVGADLLTGSDQVRSYFPYLGMNVQAALHVRRGGWLSAQQLGMVLLLHKARARGVQVLSGRVSAVEQSGGRVTGVQLQDGSRIAAPLFINAAGPFLKPVGQMLGVDLPVHSELHLKFAMKDSLGVLAREAPLVIWNDPQTIVWTDEERQLLAEDAAARPVLGALPPGLHIRPEGGLGSQMILVLWEYVTRLIEPVWPLPADPLFPDVALRALTTLIPGFQTYVGRAARPQVDGGYYMKTPENRPLIGRLPVDGAYVIGAFSGFGIMAACAAGELLANCVTGRALPEYAPAFAPERYQDPDYRNLLQSWGDSGQL